MTDTRPTPGPHHQGLPTCPICRGLPGPPATTPPSREVMAAMDRLSDDTGEKWDILDAILLDVAAELRDACFESAIDWTPDALLVRASLLAQFAGTGKGIQPINH